MDSTAYECTAVNSNNNDSDNDDNNNNGGSIIDHIAVTISSSFSTSSTAATSPLSATAGTPKNHNGDDDDDDDDDDDNNDKKKKKKTTWRQKQQQRDDDDDDDDDDNKNNNNNNKTDGKSQTRPRESSPTNNNVVVDYDDDDLLQRAIADAGRWAYGIVLIEMWVLTDDKTQLMRPPGGFWLDSAFANSAVDDDNNDESEHNNNHNILKMLFDPTHPQYQAPEPVSPGVGLAGVLWSEVARASSSSSSSSASSAWATAATSLNPGAAAASSAVGVGSSSNNSSSSGVMWRDMAALVDDPDHAPNQRLIQLVQGCGLGRAAAVPFSKNFGRQQGIVIYMARPSTNVRQLQHASNEAYLRSAADLMACAYALRGPRQTSVAERKMELRLALTRAKNRLLTMKRLGMDLFQLTVDHSHVDDHGGSHVCCSWNTLRRFLFHGIPTKVVSVYKKSWGSQVAAPPSFSVDQTLWTMVGVFVTIVMLDKLNAKAQQRYGTDYQIFLPPLASVVTQLYGLTSAPATQPLNIILGQALSMAIALGLKYHQQHGGGGGGGVMQPYVLQSLAAALATAVMVKLGVTHPPGAALAVVFVTDSWSWGNMAFLMVADVIAIVVAVLLNNMHEKRQYPTSWGLYQLQDIKTMMIQDHVMAVVKAVGNLYSRCTAPRPTQPTTTAAAARRQSTSSSASDRHVTTSSGSFKKTPTS